MISYISVSDNLSVAESVNVVVADSVGQGDGITITESITMRRFTYSGNSPFINRKSGASYGGTINMAGGDVIMDGMMVSGSSIRPPAGGSIDTGDIKRSGSI